MTRDAQFQLSNATSVPHRAEAHQVISSSPTSSSHRAEAHQVISRVSEELGGMPRDFHVVDGEAAIRARGLQRRPVPLPVTLVRSPTRISKRAFDIVGAIVLGLLFAPLILSVIVIIRLEGQPALFMHRRIGRHGKVFKCLKFRTMVPDAERALRDLLQAHPALRDEWTENHKLRNDPRITAIGRFLRLTSFDELPQLWNVIRGEMSLVGPRPIVRAELLRYGREVASYLAVKPGLTGLWQVKGRSDTTYRRRVAMDKYYVRNQNFLLDMYVLAVTVAVVLKRAGAY
jgi:exopolysaccharide production protein ExoY